MTTRKQAIQDWEDQCWMEYLETEESTNGVLLAKDRRVEFQRHYGGFGAVASAMFFGGNSRNACYWASEELLLHWERKPRTLWCQWAVANASETRQARKAGENQTAAIRQALQRLHARRGA